MLLHSFSVKNGFLLDSLTNIYVYVKYNLFQLNYFPIYYVCSLIIYQNLILKSNKFI